jgi:hypothetical protein
VCVCERVLWVYIYLYTYIYTYITLILCTGASGSKVTLLITRHPSGGGGWEGEGGSDETKNQMITKRVVLTRGNSSEIHRLNTAVHSLRIAEDELAHLEQQNADLSSPSTNLYPSAATDEGLVAGENLVDKIFAEFDMDGSGDIDVGELRSALARWGITVSADQFKRMVQSYDLNHDGVVDRAEFRRIIQTVVGGGDGGGGGGDGGGGCGGGGGGGGEEEAQVSEDESESSVNSQTYAL